MDKITLDIYEGKSKKTGKPFQCLKLCVGDWNTLVFPRSNFELEYIKKVLSEQ